MRKHRNTLQNRAAAAVPYVLLVGSAVVLAACGPAAEQPASEQPAAPASTVVAYEGARLIVGDGSAPIENGTFTVDDGSFVEVGASGAVAIPEGAARVDLSGMTVMPAIIDAHVHMSTTRDELIADLQRRAYFGVGAAISMGSDDIGTPLEIRDEAIPDAARFLSAGLGITSPEPGRRQVHWVTTEDAARQAVREEAARNVDMIKIWVDDRDGQYEQLSPEIYAAVIDEAHANDLPVAAHIFDLEDGKGLLRAGVDVFAHGVRDRDIDQEFLDLVAGRPEVVLVPNLPPRGVPTDLGWLAGTMPDDRLQALQATEADHAAQQMHGIQARNLARLSEAGMIVAFGTDGNTPWAPHVEMEDMVEAGMSPREVIVAATRNSAAVLGLADMGTIGPGKSADFIVLEADPLDDITNTRRIASVYLRGVEVDRDGIRSRLMN